jgi:integrase
MHAEANGSEYVFPGSEPTKPLRDIKKFWHSITREAGLTHVRLHDLRHVFATGALENGVPMDAIAPLLGHASTTVTKTNAHYSVEALRTETGKAAEQLAASRQAFAGS